MQNDREKTKERFIGAFLFKPLVTVSNINDFLYFCKVSICFSKSLIIPSILLHCLSKKSAIAFCSIVGGLQYVHFQYLSASLKVKQLMLHNNKNENTKHNNIKIYLYNFFVVLYKT